MLNNLMQILHERNIKLQVVEGKLKVFDVDGNLDNELLSQLRTYKEELLAIFSQNKGFTPSDFPFANLTQEQLDNIESSYREVENIYPAVPMQQGMLFHGFEDGTGESYTSQTVYKLNGQLDNDKFIQAWQMVAKRHDTFRTCFVGFETQTINQLVLSDSHIPFETLEWQDLEPSVFEQKLEEFKKADKNKGFDFAKAPLMRLTKVSGNNKQFYLVWTRHHSLLDGWCQSIVFKEVMHCYDHLSIGTALALSDTTPYQSYIQWLVEQKKDTAKEYWNHYLDGFSESTPLVVDEQIDLAEPEDTIGRFYFNLDQTTTEKLRKLANESGITMNTVFQAAWSLLLSCYSGKTDVVFGATVSGRPAEVSGIESIVGLFINSLPVRVKFDEFKSVTELLQNLSQSYANSNAYSYCPLNEIQRDCEINNGAALFDSLVIFSNFAELDQAECDVAAANSLTLESVQTDEHTNYGLTFMVTMGDELSVRITYPKSRFSEQVLGAMGEHICNLLTSMSDGFEQSLSELKLLSPPQLDEIATELLQIQRGKQTRLRLNELFEQQCEKSPNSQAIKFLDRNLTFQELNEKANQLAHLLKANGVKAGDNVALCLERCEDIPISILAILKAGAAYVPLDRFYPRNRFQNIFVEADVKLILVHNDLQMLPGLEGPVSIAIDHPDTIDRMQSLPVSNLVLEEPSNDKAYIIFTSGSCGKPKGVEVSHNNICHFRDEFSEQLSTLGLASDCAWLWHVSYTFDASLKAMAVLCHGGSVTMAAESQYQDPSMLLTLMRENNIQVFNGIPQLVELMIDVFDDSDNYHLILSGDVISSQIHQRTIEYITKASRRAINAYGPTELTVNIAYNSISESESINAVGQVVPFNFPIVVSPLGNILPKMIPGELCVMGENVCMGYVNNPELNDNTFCDYNLIDEPSRFYKTGDRVMLNDDKILHFVGRVDEQVKIRGYRIELSEVREALGEVELIDTAYVCVLTDSIGINYNVAYCTLKDRQDLESSEQTVEEIRQRLAKLIPEYMIPSHIQLLQELPKTASGKVNKSALTNPLECTKTDDATSPQTEVEKVLHNIWCEVLGRDSIDINDNFFSIGGDSIISMQIMAMAKRNNVTFSVRQLLIGQSIRGLADMIESEHQETSKQVDSGGYQTLLPIQQRFFDIDSIHVNQYNQSLLLKVPGEFNFSHLCDALHAIVSRHDVLRLKFMTENGKWYSKYRDIDSINLTTHCFEENITKILESNLSDFMWERGTEIQQSLDITAGTLFKAVYFNRGEATSGRVLLCFHHLITDAVSRWVLTQDLSSALENLAKGEEIQLDSKVASYQQWTQYLTDALESGTFDNDRKYWLEHYKPVEKKLPDESLEIKEPEKDNFEFAELILSEEKVPQLASLDKYDVEDMLISALMYGLASWSGEESQHIDMESHGRLALDGAPDVSQTMGWFTSVYPVSLEVGNSSPEQVYHSLKALRDGLPNNGIGFGLFKYFANDKEMREQLKGQSANVVFNFLSDVHNSQETEQQIDVAKEAVGPQYDLDRVTPYQFNVLSFIESGSIHMQFNYSNREYTVARVNALTAEIETALEVLLSTQLSPSKFVASDEISVEQDNVLVELNQSQETVNLFCIHPVGGYANHYESMAASMTDVCQVVGIQAPDIFSNYQTDNVETLVSYYIELIKGYQPSGPYHLLGWSAGARIAYEVATQLTAQGKSVGLVGLLDQSPNESLETEVKRKYSKVESFFGSTLKVDWSTVNDMSAESAITYLATESKQQGLAHKSLSNEQIENYIRFLITFPQAMEQLEMKESTLDLHLYKALDDEEALRYGLNHCYNWDKLTSGDINVKRVAGNHSNMIERPYVDSLIEPLKADLLAFNKQVD